MQIYFSMNINCFLPLLTMNKVVHYEVLMAYSISIMHTTVQLLFNLVMDSHSSFVSLRQLMFIHGDDSRESLFGVSILDTIALLQPVSTRQSQFLWTMHKAHALSTSTIFKDFKW